MSLVLEKHLWVDEILSALQSTARKVLKSLVSITDFQFNKCYKYIAFIECSSFLGTLLGTFQTLHRYL